MSITSLFRASKTRSSLSQDQLRSRSLQHKQQHVPTIIDRSIYLNSYNVDLPEHSIELLRPTVAALTGSLPLINKGNRDVHTVAMWSVGTASIYRCCFIQPEVTTATSTIPLSKSQTAKFIIGIISENIPGSIPCRVTVNVRTAQVSGRMTPYVTSELKTEHEWTFLNLSKSKLLFVCTDDNGSHILTLSAKSMQILQAYMPPGSICVFDVGTSAYKVTVRPSTMLHSNDANKNTCMLIYADGAFKFLGKPQCMPAVAMSFRTALLSVASSASWPALVSSLEPLALAE